MLFIAFQHNFSKYGKEQQEVEYQGHVSTDTIFGLIVSQQTVKTTCSRPFKACRTRKISNDQLENTICGSTQLKCWQATLYNQVLGAALTAALRAPDCLLDTKQCHCDNFNSGYGEALYRYALVRR